MNELPSAIGDFEAINIGQLIHKLTLRGTKYITGATQTIRLDLPVAHRLMRLELKHTDNTDADSTDAFEYRWRRKGINDLYTTLRGDPAASANSVIEHFGVGYESEGREYILYLNPTTATDRIYPTLYIQLLDIPYTLISGGQ